ncbi:hypothetical protein AAZX31_03G100800 [Glycine max]
MAILQVFACSFFSKTETKLLSLKNAVSTFSLITSLESRHLYRWKGINNRGNVLFTGTGSKWRDSKV